MSDFMAKMRQIRFGLGLRPRPRWGRLQRSPRPRGVNLVQNVGGRPVQGVWWTEVPSGAQGRSPGRRSGGRSPPEAEAILDFYMHNFDLILNYFCFARATSGWLCCAM